jgi:hypothetical protein
MAGIRATCGSAPVSIGHGAAAQRAQSAAEASPGAQAASPAIEKLTPFACIVCSVSLGTFSHTRCNLTEIIVEWKLELCRFSGRRGTATVVASEK